MPVNGYHVGRQRLDEALLLRPTPPSDCRPYSGKSRDDAFVPRDYDRTAQDSETVRSVAQTGCATLPSGHRRSGSGWRKSIPIRNAGFPYTGTPWYARRPLRMRIAEPPFGSQREIGE